MKLCFPHEDLETYAAFAAESQDAIEVIEQRVLRLEGVNAQEEIAPIFRCLHTLKGNSSFTKLTDFTRLSHQLENLFDLLRQQKMEITEELIQLFLQNFDLLGRMIEDLRSALPRVETVGKFSVLQLADIDVEEALKNVNDFVESQSGVALPVMKAEVAPAESMETIESAEQSAQIEEIQEAAENPHRETQAVETSLRHPQEITLSELEDVFVGRPENPVETGEVKKRDEMPHIVPVTDASIENFVLTDEMKKSFQRESAESLAEMEQLALAIQKNPEDKFALLDLFRVLHSLKGNCGFFALAEMETLSHRLESALGEFTREGVRIGVNLVPVTLKGIDALRLAASEWAAGGSGRVPNLETLLAEMDKLIRTAGSEVPIGEILISEGKVQPEEVEEALDIQKRKLGEILVDTGKIKEHDLTEALKKQKTLSPPGSGKTGLEGLSEGAAPVREGAKDLRVDLNKIDHLLDLVGELVIASSMVVNNEDLKDKTLEKFEKASYHLNHIVHELQNVTLSIRMIPVEATFRKMSRLVHDLSVKSGKKVSLELHGEKTEIDKNIIELVVDPLVHMIRNSMDHGLELPDERAANGKNPSGKILLKAYQEGGEICIALQDDGRGLNREKILAKARERGLLKSDEEPKDDQGIYALIFEPGFSTAEKITSTSGRGVGMDVVKSHIDKLKGKILIETEKGQGTTFTLRIPLTLSIIEGMKISVGKTQYIIPMTFISEAVVARKNQITRLADGQEIFHLRGESYPVLRMHRLHHVSGGREVIEEGALVLLEARGESFGLLVDEILGLQQTVVKAIPSYLGNVAGVSSCSILPNGDICLILDAPELLKRASESPESSTSLPDPA